MSRSNRSRPASGKIRRARSYPVRARRSPDDRQAAVVQGTRPAPARARTRSSAAPSADPVSRWHLGVGGPGNRLSTPWMDSSDVSGEILTFNVLKPAATFASVSMTESVMSPAQGRLPPKPMILSQMAAARERRRETRKRSGRGVDGCDEVGKVSLEPSEGIPALVRQIRWGSQATGRSHRTRCLGRIGSGG
jgi:hypothetical protein